ncbi:hypothetical protein [Nonomuraea endophytica]|uniref:Uncharacterized protein n=1 Tax=Nonomuraea endophytica TaxID=714136 RepID=A0A7W8A9Y2_9ACTN|nr:hypothetical protein [Nonomuraea endophytica]MBB5082282.1 hypothetical protein [Nonomuraea endophytica]
MARHEFRVVLDFELDESVVSRINQAVQKAVAVELANVDLSDRAWINNPILAARGGSGGGGTQGIWTVEISGEQIAATGLRKPDFGS